ncbi:MAG: FadR/GntR family transcriptional regulator [Paracoccaceae bacterium]
MVSDNLHGLGAAEIASQFRRQIARGDWQRHDRLPSERRLAETYGVARGTVRQALIKLAEENYVEVRAGSGTYVVHDRNSTSESAIGQANPLELIDARFALEPHMCRLAVLHGRRADFDRMDELCGQMEEFVGDSVAFAHADSEFHRVLANCTGNRLLIWIIGQITSVRSQDEWRRMRQLTLNESIISQYNAQHRQILDAIRSREPERAATKMKEHLETARLSLTRASAT